MFTEYLIAIVLFLAYLSIIVWSFGRLPIFAHSPLSGKGLTILFAVKLLFSIATVLVYTYYYTDRQYADIYKYFDDSKVIYDAGGQHPGAFLKVVTGIGFDDTDTEIKEVLANTQHFDKRGAGVMEANNRLVIRLHTVLRFFSHGNIYIHTLIFCFLSFIGCVALYRALQPFFEYGHGRVLIVPVFLMPSILFWSSGLLKETLVMFFLGILANIAISIVCFLFVYTLKPFIAFSFLAAFYLMATGNLKSYARIIAGLVGVGIVLWIFYAHNTFICEIMSSLIAKRNEFIALGLKMKAGSLTDSTIREAGCTVPLRLLPSGIYNMFMQPAVWSKSLFEKIFGLENLLILLFSVVALFYFKQPKRAKRQLVVFSTVFFGLNYALIGITVPIIGALVRYKVFGLLFYLILVFSLMSLRKFISDIQKLPFGLKMLQGAKKLLLR
jgi:hypothetical protein